MEFKKRVFCHQTYCNISKEDVLSIVDKILQEKILQFDSNQEVSVLRIGYFLHLVKLAVLIDFRITVGQSHHKKVFDDFCIRDEDDPSNY